MFICLVAKDINQAEPCSGDTVHDGIHYLLPLTGLFKENSNNLPAQNFIYSGKDVLLGRETNAL